MVYEKVSNKVTVIQTLHYAAFLVTHLFLKNTWVHPAIIMFNTTLQMQYRIC